MRISVDGGGYLAAATAFSDANHAAALAHDTLAGKLGGFAAIAGDDAGAAEFAAAYDQAAADALAGLGEVVDAFAAIGRLTDASLANHHRAEDASIIPGSIIPGSIIPGAIVYEGSPLPTHDYLTVLATTPPSSLGGDLPTLTDRENWILDHLEAIAWPTADTDRLRDAAHAWRSTAESIDRLTVLCDAAAHGLESELSPEIPLALAAIADLRATIAELAGHHAALADACETYADHVDTKRAELHLLLQEILQMIVEGIVISVAIGFISAGAGAVVGGSAVAARVAAQTPRFAAILTSLRALTTATVHHLNATRAGLHAARARLDKLLRAPIRTERGHFALTPSRWSRGFLYRHEGPGHAISRHVGLSRAELDLRFAENSRLQIASTFTDMSTAERTVLRSVRLHEDEVSAWTDTQERTLTLVDRVDDSVGLCVNRSGQELAPRYVRVVLERHPSMPDGFFVKTAYPTP